MNDQSYSYIYKEVFITSVTRRRTQVMALGAGTETVNFV